LLEEVEPESVLPELELLVWEVLLGYEAEEVLLPAAPDWAARTLVTAVPGELLEVLPDRLIEDEEDCPLVACPLVDCEVKLAD